MKIKPKQEWKREQTQFIVKLSQAYSSTSSIQLHNVIVQSTSKRCYHLAQT